MCEDEICEIVSEILLGRRTLRFPGQVGEPTPVSAELVREHAETEPATGVARRSGQFVGHQPDHGHGIPFEPLRSVDRQQLDHILLGRLRPRCEVVLTLRMVEPREEAGHGACIVGVEERMHLVHERTQLRGRDARRAARLIRRQFDVEAQLRLDQADEFADRGTHRSPEPAERQARVLQTHAPLLREVGQPAVRHGLASDEVEGIDQRHPVVRRAGTERLDDRRGKRRQRGVVPGQTGGEIPERTEVGEPDRPAWAAEQTQQRRAGVGIAQDAEDRDDVHDLRCGEQPAEAEDAVRDSASAERIREPHHVLLIAEEHGARRRPALRGTLATHAVEPLGDPIGFGIDVGLEHHVHVALRRVRPGPQRWDVDRSGVGQRSQNGVRGDEDSAGIAPAGHEREALTRGVPCERAGEAAQIACARAAPPIDCLMGITDGHHRGIGEQCRQKVRLDDRGVLVLVQEDDPVAAAHLLAHLRVPRDGLEGAGHLVGEIDQTAASLGFVVVARQSCEEGQGLNSLNRRRDIGVDRHPPGDGGPLEHITEPLGEPGQVLPGDEVVHSVPRDPQRGVDDGAQRLPSRLESRVVRGEHDAPHEEPGGGLRQHRGVGITTHSHRVLAHDLIREAVVGGHAGPVQEGVALELARHRPGRVYQRREVSVSQCLSVARGSLDGPEDVEVAVPMKRREVREEAEPLELGQAGQTPLDALGEFTGGLPREGEPEDLVARDDAVGDEPHDPRGHGLGLPAARAGDHEGRGES